MKEEEEDESQRLLEAFRWRNTFIRGSLLLKFL
jgi:hypothetical protein